MFSYRISAFTFSDRAKNVAETSLSLDLDILVEL